MPNFEQPAPRYKPFKCAAYWHLRPSGLYLAVYDLIGGVTAGGKNSFFSSKQRVGQYFGCHYNSVRVTFAGLVKLGWLEPTGERKFRYITHEEWAAKHPGHCNERDDLPWQMDTDPLCRQLYAIADGKLRLFVNQVISIKQFASEGEILELFRKETEAMKAKKARGAYDGTTPRQSFWRVYNYLKQLHYKRQLLQSQQNAVTK